MSEQDPADAEDLRRQTLALEEQVKHLFKTERRLYETQLQLQRQLKRIHILNQFALETGGILSPSELIGAATELLLQVFALDQAVGFGTDSGRLVPRVVRAAEGFEPDTSRWPESIEFGFRLHAPMVFTGDRALNEHPQLSAPLACLSETFGGDEGGHSLQLVIPLWLDRDRLVGLLVARRLDPSSVSVHEELPSDRDLPFLRLLAAHVEKGADNWRLLQERTEIEERLRQAEKDRAIGRLAGGIAHDFNNYLTVILGNAAELAAGMAETSPLRKLADGVIAAADHSAVLTRQLLAVSRRQLLERRVLDVNQLVDDTDQMLRRIIGEEIELETHTRATARVRADAAQLGQVLLNLAVNAKDAMPNGGRLTIETEDVVLDGTFVRQHAGIAPGQHVKVSVSDTGAGMERETLGRIFEPFFTTKELGRGTGLGLAMVHGIVQQHEGTVDVISDVGEGATFAVYLPACSEEVEPTPVRARPTPASSSGTILVVEDQDAVRSIARRTLEVAGYTVIEAEDGLSALEQLEHHPGDVDLVLTDVIMPRMGGFELARRLIAQGLTARVLFMTGYTDDLVSDQEESADIVMLQKPFTPTQLLELVKQCLDAGSGAASGPN